MNTQIDNISLRIPILCALLLGLLAIAPAANAIGGRVEICHFPPGNPANFHTITVSSKAVDKHRSRQRPSIFTICRQNVSVMPTRRIPSDRPHSRASTGRVADENRN